MAGKFLKLETEGRDLYLNGMRIKGIEDFNILKNSTLPIGKAELKITLIVDYPDNKQGQSLSQVEIESE